MRVLRVLTRPNLGGPTAQAVALWHASRALGARTLLVTGRCGGGEPLLDPGAHGVPRLSWRAAVAAGPRAEGVVELPCLLRRPAPLGDHRARRALLELMRAFAPQVVHTHTSKAGVVGRRAAHAAGVPCVAHTYHGLVLRGYYPRPLAALLQRLEASLARNTDLVFAVSETCRDELLELGVTQRAAEVLPPAVALPRTPLTRAAARRQLGVSPDEVALGFVGRLVPIKRPDLFADAVARVPVAGVRGHVFGGGPLRGRLRREHPSLRVHGAVAGVAEVLPAFDVLVVSSEREGCPLVAVEAFAAGVPVVGFDVPGVRDALATWGDGVLVPRAAGADGLARAVQRVLSEPGLRQRLARRGRGAVARFHPDRVAAQLHDGYETVVCQRDRGLVAVRRRVGDDRSTRHG